MWRAGRQGSWGGQAALATRGEGVRSRLHDPDVDYLEGVAAAPSLLAAQVALVRAQELYGLRRVLNFHPRVAAAADFARTLLATRQRVPGATATDVPLVAWHVHGEMDAALRAQVLDHLRDPPPGGWTVVSNVRCLGEGVDIPAVDGVVFVDPKRQDTAIVQAIGRAVRCSPGTTDTAVIVVPIVIADARSRTRCRRRAAVAASGTGGRGPGHPARTRRSRDAVSERGALG
jgi:superfamily II DNA or RNA helicase